MIHSEVRSWLCADADLCVSMSDSRKGAVQTAAVVIRRIIFSVQRRDGSIANLHDGSVAGDGTMAEIICDADLPIGL